MKYIRELILAIAGVLAGICITIYGVFYAARKYMVVPHKSSYDFDETVKRMQSVVENTEGWVFPIKEWNFFDAMLKHNKPFKSVSRLVVYFVCNATYAQKMINIAPFMASMMPCGWVVYERNGTTYIGVMNIALLAKCFKGVQRSVFDAVAQDQAKMLDQIL